MKDLPGNHPESVLRTDLWNHIRGHPIQYRDSLYISVQSLAMGIFS